MPSGLNSIPFTMSSWVILVSGCLTSLSTCQIEIVLPEPVATRVPSGLNLAIGTMASARADEAVRVPLVTSQSVRLPSLATVAT